MHKSCLQPINIYFAYFLDENITIDVLKVIQIHHIKDLLKDFKIGERILFEHNLSKWRTEMGIPLYSTFSNTEYKQLPFSPSEISSHSSPASSIITSISRNRASPEPIESQLITLSHILNETNKGQLLSKYYETHNKFQEEQRNILITLVAQYFEDSKIHLSLKTSHRLEDEIIHRFPTEEIEYYRTGKRGKIYAKYSNLKTSLKSLVGSSKDVAKANSSTSTKSSRKFGKFIRLLILLILYY